MTKFLCNNLSSSHVELSSSYCHRKCRNGGVSKPFDVVLAGSGPTAQCVFQYGICYLPHVPVYRSRCHSTLFKLHLPAHNAKCVAIYSSSFQSERNVPTSLPSENESISAYILTMLGTYHSQSTSSLNKMYPSSITIGVIEKDQKSRSIG